MEQVPELRKVILDTKELAKLDTLYWKQQLALVPEPERIQEYWTKLAYFYNHMTASKELFAIIRCPVLVLAGERDLNAPLPTVVNAYYMLQNSQLSIIPKAGHTVFSENFPAVWTSITPFLRQ